MATTIEEAVRAFLLQDTNVQPYVGGGTQDPKTGRYSGNIWDQLIPQTFARTATVCCIGMKVLNQENDRTLAAACRERNTLLLLSVQGLNESLLAHLAGVIVGKLDGYTTKRIGDGQTYVWCQYCHVVDVPEEFVSSPHGDDLGVFVRPIACQFAWLSQ